ncbi:MAG TPA: SprT-like domain-containing protein [Phnomibacter sp.]|nr:SprT-like domain-containing protein [Phnomibacter sp.]
MARKKYPFEALKPYLPPGSFDLVMPVILQHKVQLTITPERQSKLGDYRSATHLKNHRISINGNLNPYAFLLTLLHEFAHLLAFEKHGYHIQAHGREWKREYGAILNTFLQNSIFPDNIAAEVQLILHNPGASSCADEGLMRVLKLYDAPTDGKILVEQLAEGQKFKIANGKYFIRGKKLRKRILCTEYPGNRVYLFSPVYEVAAVS